MAIERNTAWTTVVTDSTADTGSFTFNAGSNKLLIVSIRNGTAPQYDSTNLTQIGSSDLWYMLETDMPGSAGAYNITWSGTGHSSCVHAICLNNVDQTTPVGNTTNDTLGTGSTDLDSNYNHTDMSASRAVVANARQNTTPTNADATDGGGADTMYSHLAGRYRQTSGGTQGTLVSFDDLSTNVVGNTFPTSGSATFDGDITVPTEGQVTGPKEISWAEILSAPAVVEFVATVNAAASLTPALTVHDGTPNLLSTINAVSSVTVSFNRTVNFSSTVNAVSSVTADVTVPVEFSTTVNAVSSVTATMETDQLVTVLDSTTFQGNITQLESPQRIVFDSLATHSTGDMLLLIVDASQGFQISYGGSNVTPRPEEDWFCAETNRAGYSVYQIYWKIAESSSDTFTVNGLSTNNYRYMSYTLSNATHVLAWQGANEGTITNGTSPFMDLDFEVPVAFIVGLNTISSTLATVAPSGYSNLLTNVNMSTAEKETVAQTETPGAWTNPADSGEAYTIAVYRDDRSNRVQKTWTLPVFGSVTIEDWIPTSLTQSTWSNLFTGSVGYFTSAYVVGRSTSGLNTVSDDGYLRWSGTFADLGVPSDKNVFSVVDAFVYERASARNTDASLGGGESISLYFGDADGTGAAFEMIHDPNGSPTSYTLIANQSEKTAFEAWNGTMGSATDRTSMSSALTGLNFEHDDEVELRLHIHSNIVSVDAPIKAAQIEFDWPSITFGVGSEQLVDTTAAATSTVSASLEVARPLTTTVAATSTVAGNIDETRKLMGVTVAQSSLIGPTNLEVDRQLVTTVTLTSLVNPGSFGFDKDFASITSVVSTISPNEFFYGLITTVAATSTVGATLEVDRPMNTTVAAQGVVNQSALQREIDWGSTTSVASALFPALERTVPLIAEVHANHSLEANFRLAGKFSTTISVASTVGPVVLGKTVNWVSTTSAVSNVNGNIVEGLRFLTGIIAQSAIINADLVRTVNWDTSIAVQSALTVDDFQRQVDWATLIQAQSASSGILVVITNTLELTYCETSLVEVEECVLQFVETCVDSVVIINELDEVTISFEETLDDVLIGSTC